MVIFIFPLFRIERKGAHVALYKMKNVMCGQQNCSFSSGPR